MALDPKIRTGLAKEGRLWILAAICAVPGAIVADRTQDWWAGAAIFAACFVVLGPLLWVYERRKKRAAAIAHNPRDRQTKPAAGADPTPGKKQSVSKQHGQQKRNKPQPGTGGRGR